MTTCPDCGHAFEKHVLGLLAQQTRENAIHALALRGIEEFKGIHGREPDHTKDAQEVATLATRGLLEALAADDPSPTIIEVDVEAGCWGNHRNGFEPCPLADSGRTCSAMRSKFDPINPAPEDCPLRHGDVLVRAKGRATADDDALAAKAAGMTHQDLLDLARRTTEDTTRQVVERITEMEKERSK